MTDKEKVDILKADIDKWPCYTCKYLGDCDHWCGGKTYTASIPRMIIKKIKKWIIKILKLEV